MQAIGEQFVTVEDSMSVVHRSRGGKDPAAATLRSEVAIVCGLARTLLGPQHPVCWEMLAGDYDLVREHIAAMVPGWIWSASGPTTRAAWWSAAPGTSGWWPTRRPGSAPRATSRRPTRSSRSAWSRRVRTPRCRNRSWSGWTARGRPELIGRVTAQRRILRLGPDAAVQRVDTLAVEEPLELRVGGRALSVTMRTRATTWSSRTDSCSPRGHRVSRGRRDRPVLPGQRPRRPTDLTTCSTWL